jgi:DNA-binding transcriptional LysR family regulator
MSLRDVDWDLCRSFLAVVREGSLSSAARALALTQPTVGRHIESLEAKLGAVLFTRSQHGLNPTEIALDLVPHVEAMGNAADALIRAASGPAEGSRGTVRLTASEVVGAEVLPPMLARFRAQHPGVVIELKLSNRTEDLLLREADIAVRMLRPEQIGLVARLIGQTTVSLYAHRCYAERHALPRTLEELVATPFDRLRHRDLSTEHHQDRHCRDHAGSFQSAYRFRSGAARGVARELWHWRLSGCACASEPDLLPVMHDTIRFELPIC